MLDIIIHEISAVMSKVDEENVSTLAVQLYEKKKQGQGKIFVVGEGRSGLVAKAFAMRLMHLGAEVYVVGETITPSIQVMDIMVAISGSGTTAGVVRSAQKAQQLGCFVVAVTTNEQSELGQIADFILNVPAATKYRKEGETPSIQPLSSLFDQSVHILLDATCLAYAKLAEESSEESCDDALRRHSNLE